MLYNLYNGEGQDMVDSSEFGVYFKATRAALGLTLRGFCSQNGFDPGNVSRIERGLSPPPKSDEALNKYAKALKLKRGTEAYNRFLDLAATETGRIPSELLGNQATADQLPKLLRQLRSGPGHRNWITARHIEEWANKLDARALLPQLVRRLVHATGRALTYIEFPAGEQTQRPGLDGVSQAAEPDAFVPLGRSVYEMGVNKDPAAKAEGDFEKRRKQKLGFDKKETTYIVITPRKWQGKGVWAAAKNKLGVWNEVRVYDSANLEEWLEHAPAVDVWLARLLGVRSEGLADLDEYWDNVQGSTEPPLKPEVFLASREKKAEELERWYAGPASVAAIETRSPSEAVDFVAAVMRKSASREREAARTVIVEAKEAWRSICRSGSKLALIAHPDLVLEADLVAEAVRQGHHVVLPVTQALTDRAFTLELPRVYRHHLEKALELSGMKRMDATDYAEKAGGSLTVLKRLLAKVQGTSLPLWSHGADAAQLVPMLLAGAWEEQNEEDRRVLERLSGHPYNDVLVKCERWFGTPDSPLFRVLSRWNLVSRDDSWLLLSHAITQDHLKLFEQAALDVLGEVNPALELPPDERWMAGINNKSLRHSGTIRSAVAQTLALLGARTDRLRSMTERPRLVGHIVERLLSRREWQRWASLSHQLPLLAEAAPDAFLKAVEQDLKGKDPALPRLFEQGGNSPLFSSSPHTGLLWALEGLAWDRGLLPRVCDALVRLDELLAVKDRGNSPIRSLQAFFMPWYPQTTATVDERVKILKVISRKHPSTGWRLLLELLPQRFGHTTPIRRPAFRDWALVWNEGATTADYERQVVQCAELMVGQLGGDVTRWKNLIENFENLAVPAGEKLLERFLTFDVSTFDTPVRRTISEALREKVSRHRRFEDADWALPEVILSQLEEAQQRFEPGDAISRNAWLFNQIWEVIAHDGEHGHDEVVELRNKALREVVSESGWDGVLKLADIVRAPEELGDTIGASGTTKDDAKVLPVLFETDDAKSAKFAFARGYVFGRFRANSWDWVDRLKIGKWSAIAVAELALTLPAEPRTWALVAKQGKEAEKEYWLKTGSAVRDPKPETVRSAAAKLLEYGRPFQGCFVIGMARHQKCPVESELMLQVLEAGLSGPLAESEQNGMSLRRHNVIELIQHLQEEVKRNASDVERSKVARIEWGYLDLLDGHPASPSTLHDMLKSESHFFVELLGVIFRSGEEDEEVKATEEQKARARNAFRLLMSWNSVPGSREDTTIDEDALLSWVRSAREKAERQGHLEVCDIRIGNVFAHAPIEKTDGGWPCIAVRDTIEEIGSDELENGFEVGIYNKCGVHVKALDAGGEQERRLAKMFSDWAGVCMIEWPRTSSSLRRVAEGYEREAERADVETELRLT